MHISRSIPLTWNEDGMICERQGMPCLYYNIHNTRYLVGFENLSGLLSLQIHVTQLLKDSYVIMRILLTFLFETGNKGVIKAFSINTHEYSSFYCV